jgi:DNA-binding NtrC family response regulator
MEIWNGHQAEIDLVLTDVVMPGGMNGKELGQHLLEENPKLKIIYMSGYSADHVCEDFPLQEGVNFLAKPFPSNKLTEIIQNRLNS